MPSAIALLALAWGATLTIWSTDPVWDRLYVCGSLALTSWCLWRDAGPAAPRFALALLALPLWGLAQYALGLSEDRAATLAAALRAGAWCGSAWCAYRVFGSRPGSILHGFAWTGFLLAVAGVLAYYTSPGRILWLLPSPYPDTWGPFLSRNNFAQLLELTFPPALWLACTRPRRWLYWTMALSIFTAGLVSASRAGAVLLVLEACFVFWFSPRRRNWAPAGFAAAAAALSAVAGAGTLVGRFGHALLAERVEIYQSALAMIATRPWTGYGLGTFALVYPEFALFDSGYTVEHAHNDWLEWAAEGGAGYAFAWLLVVLPPLRKLPGHPWAAGAGALLLHSAVDFPLSRSGIAGWAFLLLGGLEAARPPTFASIRRPS